MSAAAILLMTMIGLTAGWDQSSLASQTCSGQRQSLTLTPGASAWLGMLVPQRSRAADAAGYGCGNIRGDAQPVEAVRWMLGVLNQNSGTVNGVTVTQSYVPGITLGVQVGDTCSNQVTRGATIANILPQTLTNGGWCAANSSSIFLGFISETPGEEDVVGVASQNTDVNQIVYKSPFGSTNSMQASPFLLRTVPNVIAYSLPVVAVLQKLQWTFIAIVYTSDDVGEQAGSQLRRDATNAGLCVTLYLPLPFSSTQSQGSSGVTGIQQMLQQIVNAGVTGVVFAGNRDAALALSTVAQSFSPAGSLQWVFVDLFADSLASTPSAATYVKGSITVTPTLPQLTAFKTFWTGLNPASADAWFADWFMNTFQCRLSSVTSPPYPGTICSSSLLSSWASSASFVQNPYAASAALAVYAYANALKRAQADLCGVQPGVCAALAAMTASDFFTQYVTTTNVAFDSQERLAGLSSANRLTFTSQGFITDLGFDVWNVVADSAGNSVFRKVGTFVNSQLSLNASVITMYSGTSRVSTVSLVPSSACASTPCSACLPAASFSLADHTVSVGQGQDLTIAAVFSVHQPGTGASMCGALNTRGVGLLQAFTFAVSMVEQSGLLSPLHLGGIAFDDCSSGQVATQALGALGGLPTVVGVVGGQTEESTVALLPLLTGANVPFISYAGVTSSSAGTPPNVVNSGPSQASYTAAVMSLLQSSNVTYIQLIYASRRAQWAQDLRAASALYGVCVSRMTSVQDSGSDFITALNVSSQNAQAAVIVLLVDSALFTFPSPAALPDGAISGRYFIVPLPGETVNSLTGSLQAFLAGVASIAVVPTARQASTYQNYLQTINPATYTANPWLRESFQKTYSCYLSVQYNPNNYPVSCASLNVNASAAPVPADVTGVIDAVEVLARAIQNKLSKLCSGGATLGVCSSFRSAGIADSAFSQSVAALNFTDLLGNTVAMTTNGQLMTTIDIYTMKSSTTKVGSFSTATSTLQLAGPITSLPSSRCQAVCAECSYLFDADVGSGSVLAPGDLYVGVTLDVHSAASFQTVCGDVTNDYQYYEAVRYALNKVNSGTAPVSLKGVTLGAIIIDTCRSVYRANSMVADAYASDFQQLAASAAPSTRAKPSSNNVVTWVTGLTDTSSSVSEVLTSVNVSQVAGSAYSPPSSSPVLFYRASPSEDVAIAGIVQLLKQTQWNYIQVVYESSGERGQAALSSIQNQALAAGICIIQSVALTSSSSSSTLATLQAQSQASVVVIFASSANVVKLLQANYASSSSSNFVFIISDLTGEVLQMIDSSNSNSSSAWFQNTIVFADDLPQLPDFDSYMATLRPPSPVTKQSLWLAQYMELAFQCSLGVTDNYARPCANPSSLNLNASSSYRQNHFVASVVASVYAVTSALDKTLTQICGVGYTGVCDAFLTDGSRAREALANNLAAVSFQLTPATTFSFTQGQRQFLPDYTVSYYDRSGAKQQIGRMQSLTLVSSVQMLSSIFSSPPTCGQLCSVCKRVEPVSTLPGDILIGGVFDVHNAGTAFLTCGSIKTSRGIQLLEAFNFALSYVNSRSGLFAGRLGNVTLGGVGVDACSDSDRAGQLVANMFSNGALFQPGVQASLVDVFVGAFSSDATIAVAKVLSPLGIPQVSYGATSLALSDTTAYPNFLRTVPADDKLARALVALLRQSAVSYVQVVYSGSYGSGASATFIKYASAMGVCVAQNVHVTSSETTVSSSEVTAAVNALFQAPDATLVIAFLVTEHIGSFMQGVSSNTRAASTFSFIGSDSWSANINGALLGGVNVITLGVETADVTDFDGYLRTKTPNNYQVDPWFNEFYLTMFSCYTSTPSPQCSSFSLSVVNAPSYQQDRYVLYVINAVFSAALGIDKVLQQLCGYNYTTLCVAYSQSTNRKQLIQQAMQLTNFTDYTKQLFVYQNGESNRGFHIYRFDAASGYVQVGSYNDTYGLKMQASFKAGWRSTCSNSSSCNACVLPVGGTSPYSATDNVPAAPSIVAFGPVHDASTTAGGQYQCGSVNLNGFQSVLAYFYSVSVARRVGSAANLADIGAVFSDTCGNAGKTFSNVYTFLSSPLGASGQPRALMYAVTGSDDAAAAASLLCPVNIPLVAGQLSASSTSAYSTSSRTFACSSASCLLSTLPDLAVEASAIVAVLRRMKWQYVGVIASSDNDGQTALNAFLAAAANTSAGAGYICVIGVGTVSDTSPTAQQVATAWQVMTAVPDLSVVVMLASTGALNALLASYAAQFLNNRYVLVGGRSWGASMAVVSGVQSSVVGSIIVAPPTATPIGYQAWLRQLTPANHAPIADDWFEDVWQTVHQCQIINATRVLTKYPRTCSDTEQPLDNYFTPGQYFVYGMAASLAGVQALQSAISRQCANATTSNARQACINSFDYSQLQTLLATSTWSFPAGELSSNIQFSLNPFNAPFTVQTFQRGSSGSGSYQYSQLGSYLSGVLTLNTTGYVLPNGITVTSQCSNCSCLGLNGSVSTPPPPSPLPLINLNDNFGQAWGAVIIALSALGILVSLFLLIFLLIAYPIKGGTSILGYMLLFGCLTIFLLNFAFVRMPDEHVCGIRRFCLGFVHAWCFACLLVKTLCIMYVSVNPSSEFDEMFSVAAQRTVAHPCKLLLGTMVLILMQALIGIEWLILSPPSYVLVSDGTHMVPYCAVSQDLYPLTHWAELVVSCVYAMLLIGLTVLCSAFCWDSSENNYESRWILLTSCLSCLFWIAWCVTCTLADTVYRDPAICVGNLATATVILVLIYGKKLYHLHKYKKQERLEKKALPPVVYDTSLHNSRDGPYVNPSYEGGIPMDDRQSYRGSQGGTLRQ